jgi:hypothetical protein
VPSCTLNPTFIAGTKVGIFPDSATNFISGTVGVPYIQNLTVKVPVDTTSVIGGFCFKKVIVTSPNTTNYNFPPGLALGSMGVAVVTGTANGAPSLQFAGGTNNCASIYGTPTMAGSYTLEIKVTPYLLPKFGTCPLPPNVNSGTAVNGSTILNYYIINIAPPSTVGMQDIGKDKFGIMYNSPNPVTTKTEIKYYVEGEDNATLTVYNSLGAIVNTQSTKTRLGENSFTFNANGFAAGVYIYSIKYKNAVSTKRLVIAD